MMPEMRTYLDEDVTPEAEEELKLALKDVQKHYPVDTTRVFLHANCSGGYRALRIATANPNMFAAIGLYAPTYHCPFDSEWSKEHAPEKMIGRLKGIPMFIHYDPFDEHSSYDTFADLVEDCKKEGIPLMLSVKRNSGQFYNVVLVGKEALDFFEGKSKLKQ
jgi:predicted esterase